jgi:[methyl-Co(III) methanol-specific corrinoid protein]:coenzyme M methyltransferase
MRAQILDLLAGRKPGVRPAFSGLIHVTSAGLAREGLRFHEVHHDARKMALAAASTFRTTGLPSAALPLDLCLPAEALGAELDFAREGEDRFPQVRRALVESTREIDREMVGDSGIMNRGRLSIVCEALGMTRRDIGGQAVISGMIPGPYTLLVYLCNPTSLFLEMKKDAPLVMEALMRLASFLAQVGNAYLEAGADFITVHDMGGSPAFIGPPRYESLVLPAEKSLIDSLAGPCVLSICGNVTGSLKLLPEAGAQALSLDQTVDMAAARAALPNTLLFGNIDPVRTLWQGSRDQVADAVRRAKQAGADAVWPGCDLALQTPIDHLASLAG